MEIKNIRNIFILLNLVILASCQNTPPDSPSISDTPTPSIQFTITPIETQLIPTPTSNPKPSPSPSVQPLPTANVKINELSIRINLVGKLWISAQGARNYTTIDLNTGMIMEVIIPRDCYPALIPQSTISLCVQGNSVSLQDYATGVQDNLEINLWDKVPDWLYFTPNGRFLFFGYMDTESRLWSYYSYDIINKKPGKSWIEQTNQNWNVPPILSSNGASVVGSQYVGPWDNRIFEFDQFGDHHQISLNHPSATWDLAWSPVENQLVYGATDIQSEIGFYMTHLYLIDMTTKQVRQVTQVPDSRSYEMFEDDPVWSPDGHRIVVRSQNQLCIITLENMEQNCLALGEPDEIIVTYDWSPDNTALVAILGNPKNQERSVWIYNILDGESIRLIDDLHRAEYVYWRW